jgi:peroxiredoxin
VGLASALISANVFAMTVVMHVSWVTFKPWVRDESVPGFSPYRGQDLTPDEIFKGRWLVLFSLPGSFTLTW